MFAKTETTFEGENTKAYKIKTGKGPEKFSQEADSAEFYQENWKSCSEQKTEQ